jgi:PAS domain S-box-containing protein
MKNLWPKKIRNQLLIGIALVHLVMMAIFVFDTVRREKIFLQKQNHEQALSLVSNLSVNAEPFLMRNDYDGLERLVQSHRHFPFLKYAMFTSTDGLVLAHTDSSRLGSRLADHVSKNIQPVSQPVILVENDEVLDMVAPVFNSSRIIGWARVGIGQEYIHENLVNISQSGLLYIALAILVGSICAIFISGKLSKGLYKLIAAANRITAGDRNFRSEGFNSYELTQLSGAFNKMLDEIISSNKMTTLILENMPVGVWVLDKDGNILSVNSEGKRIWGGVKYLSMDRYGAYKGRSAVSGRQLGPHDWPGARAIQTGETSVNEEIEIECFDGSRKIILNSAMPLLDDEGRTMHAVIINVDITDKRKAEKDLVKVNYDIGERIKELNCLYKISEIANKSELSKKEILQRSVELIPPSYQYPHITTARIVFEKEVHVTPGFRESQWRQHASINFGTVLKGSVEVFYLEEMPASDEGPFLKEERSLINSIAGILSNAAEKRASERELRYSEEKFRGLVEQNLIGFFILQENYFRYVNPGFEQLSGYSKAEVENEMSFAKFVHEHDLQKVNTNYIHRLRGENVESNYVFRIYNKAGEIRHMEAFLSRISFEGKPAILGSLVDITDRIEEEKRINGAVTDAQEKERMQIGMELHDNVQQIMVGTLISVDFAKRKQDDKAIIESTLSNISVYIKEALEELRRLSHQLAPSVGGAGSFRDKLQQLVNTMKKMDSVRFDIQVDDNCLGLAEDIQVALYRIVQEQLSNIFKYAKATIVEIDLRKEAKVLRLSVTDNGKGFDMNKLRRGIGLENISRRVKLLDGTTHIWSEPGKGCKLMAEIPL